MHPQTSGDEVMVPRSQGSLSDKRVVQVCRIAGRLNVLVASSQGLSAPLQTVAVTQHQLAITSCQSTSPVPRSVSVGDRYVDNAVDRFGGIRFTPDPSASSAHNHDRALLADFQLVPVSAGSFYRIAAPQQHSII